MPQLIDLTNKTFGKLTVLNIFERRNKYIYWLCRCECGKQKYIRSDHIRYKKIKSCGCFEEEARRKGNNKSHNLSKTRLFKIFQGMKKRCTGSDFGIAISLLGLLGLSLGVAAAKKEN